MPDPISHLAAGIPQIPAHGRQSFTGYAGQRTSIERFNFGVIRIEPQRGEGIAIYRTRPFETVIGRSRGGEGATPTPAHLEPRPCGSAVPGAKRRCRTPHS